MDLGVEDYEDIPPERNYGVFWTILFGVMTIVILLGIYFFLAVFMKNTVSQNELIKGTSLQLQTNNTVKIDMGDSGNHNFSVDFVGPDSVNITIRSEPIKISLRINETKEVDITGDGIPDLKFRLISIVNGEANIAVKKIGTDICVENWSCSDWSECARGKQTRTCKDINSCGTVFDRPQRETICQEVKLSENNSGESNQIRQNETLASGEEVRNFSNNLSNLNQSEKNVELLNNTDSFGNNSSLENENKTYANLSIEKNDSFVNQSINVSNKINISDGSN